MSFQNVRARRHSAQWRKTGPLPRHAILRFQNTRTKRSSENRKTDHIEGLETTMAFLSPIATLEARNKQGNQDFEKEFPPAYSQLSSIMKTFLET